jgi:hypothetical protein
MKALSFTPLRAWAVFRDELRLDVECRDWRTQYRGRILVHAAASLPANQYGDAAYFLYEKLGIEDIPALEDLPRGVIVGAVTILDCVTTHRSKWFEKGRFGMVLAKPRRAPSLVRCRGQQWIFVVPKDVAMAVKEAVAA